MSKSKYHDDIPKEFIDYFDQPPYRAVTKTIVTKKGDVAEVTENEATDFRSIAGFARKVGVHRDTLHQWSKVHPAFTEVYGRAKDFQEDYLTVNGLKGYIQMSWIFVAKNVLGYRDKQPDEADKTTINNITVKSTEQIDQRLKELADKAKKK